MTKYIKQTQKNSDEINNNKVNNEELDNNIKEEIMKEVNVKINKEISKYKLSLFKNILDNKYLKSLINEPLKLTEIIKITTKYTDYIRNFIILFSVFNHVYRILFGYFPLNAFIYLFIYNILLIITIISFSILIFQILVKFQIFLKKIAQNL